MLDLEGAVKELETIVHLLMNPKKGEERDQAFAISKYEDLKRSLLAMVSKVRAFELSKDSSRNIVKPGDFVYTFIRECGLRREDSDNLLDVLDSCASILINQVKRGQNRYRLDVLKDAFKILYQSPISEKPSLLDHYRLHVQAKEVIILVKGRPTSKTDIILSLWCFNSAIAMQSLAEQGCRSIIMASGTLGPLDSFAMELGLDFPNRIENNHVIKESQIFVAAVSKGPVGSMLLSSYANRESVEYNNDLGNSIVNICRIVPDGVLVYFTSYFCLEKTIEKWKARVNGQSIWESIITYKEPFSEPKSKLDFSDVISSYGKAIEMKRGAILFAVCRGKASEGLDFSDSKARAVLICGIPFPATKDPKVIFMHN